MNDSIWYDKMCDSIWYDIDGKIHRDNDLPAVVIAGHNVCFWYQHGQIHRDGAPAIIYPDFYDVVLDVSRKGTRLWYQNGQIHRDDGPAIEEWDGEFAWYQNNQLHSINDKPATRNWDEDGVMVHSWYQHGKLHRDKDKPAKIWQDGHLEWYQHGELHRENNMPAVEAVDGRRDWYWHGMLHRDGDIYACTN